MKTNNYGNALLMHGGGLCPSSNAYLSRLAEALKIQGYFPKILMGYFSFESLLNPEEFIKEWTPELRQEAEKSFGGFYGTSRGIDLTVQKLQQTALETCKNLGISHIFVAGGDGSSRQVAEIAETFKAHGVKLIFPMALTIDGIEGSISLGLRPAVAKAIKELENYAATCLMTRDYGQFSVLCFVVQGRNRDDILVSVLEELVHRETLGGISMQEIDVYAIPANYSWDKDMLKTAVNNSDRRTLILLSEGAEVKKKDLVDILEMRKVRYVAIEHLFQMNECVDSDEIANIDAYINSAMEPITFGLETGQSFSIVYYAADEAELVPVDYYAVRNPRNGQVATLSPEQESFLKKWTP